MAFFTSQQLFGNGAGSPGSPGWVPVDTAAPPTYSANNRGIGFGEQLSSAIANRSHYALALNDDDLNTRLALFETGGLNAAYDQGALAVDGGGRLITKDGGAVETVSNLVAQYGDDIANAHFRANQIADTERGGGGFDSVSFGRAGDSALFGFLDRRGANFAGYTVVADSISTTISGSTVTVGAGQLRDGSSNTHLVFGYDMIELLDGVHAGLYVILSLSSGTAATVRNLDGSTPTFAAGAANARIFRPTFGSFSRHGHTGTLGYAANTMMGLAGYESALDLIPGCTLGRYDTASSSPDGARYAMRVRAKDLFGAVATRLDVDAQGQLTSYVTRSQLTTAQRAASANFGAPATIVTQDDPATTVDFEIGHLARSTGALERWFGFAAFGDARPATTPTGVFAFNFINTAYNVDLTDVIAADWMVSAGLTFVEILTPSPQAGVYMVSGRDAGNGNMLLVDMDGATVTFPTSGAGTMRILYGVMIGGLDYNVGTSARIGTTASGRASMYVQSPKQVGGTALLLEAGNQNANPTDYFLIRSTTAEDGANDEQFSVTGVGQISGRSITLADSSHDAITYRTAPSRSFVIPMASGRAITDAAGATPEWRYTTSPTSNAVQVSLVNSGVLIFPIQEYLREGMIITNIRLLCDPGTARVGANRITLGLHYEWSDWAVPNNNPITTQVVGGAYAFDDASSDKQIISLASVLGVGHTVEKDELLTPRAYYVYVKAGNTGAASPDTAYALSITVTDPGARNI